MEKYGLVCAFILNPYLQVESVFETLVEDSPEEESTLTSKNEHLHMYVCACTNGKMGMYSCVAWGVG